MGMIANLFRVNNETLQNYLADSSLLEERIYDEAIEDDTDFLDLDKSWDGIIFLLTGQSILGIEDEIQTVFFSGQLIDEEQDLGYGPAHYLIPKEVKQINEQIKTISAEELRIKYNPKQMEELEIYPEVWDDDEETINYLLDNFELVQHFYAEAAEKDMAIISFLN